jgi:hypothetical protein
MAALPVCLLATSDPAAAELARRLPDATLAARAAEVEGRTFDVAVAWDWRAILELFAVDARRHAYRVDGFAHHRMGEWDAERIPAALSYDLPVDFLATGRWVADALAELRPASRVLLVPDGVDPPPAAAVTPGPGGPVRVLVDDRWLPEGAPSVARDAVGRATAPLAATWLGRDDDTATEAAALAQADVLLRLDPVDGVLGSPLRAMRAGVVPVVLASGGQAELVEHDVTGIVADAEDPAGTAHRLDALAADREGLARLRAAARERAAAWPDREAAAAAWTVALAELTATEAPRDAAWPDRLMGDALAAAAAWHTQHQHLTAAVHEALAAAEAARRPARGRLLTRLRGGSGQ